MIKLNVGGTKFKTTIEVIKKIPYIYNMIMDTGSNETKIFINRSGLIFQEVFAFVIDSKHPFPKKYSYELDFYGVEYDKKKLDLHEDEIINILKTLNHHRDIKCEREWDCAANSCNEKVNCKSNFCDSCQPQCLLGKCDISTTNNNYCDKHSKIGKICNKLNCKNLRLSDEIFCYLHL